MVSLPLSASDSHYPFNYYSINAQHQILEEAAQMQLGSVPRDPLSILNLWRLRLGIQKVGGGFASCWNLLGTVLIFPNNIHTSALLKEIVAKLDFWPSYLCPGPTVSVCVLRETSVVLHPLLTANLPDWEPALEL